MRKNFFYQIIYQILILILPFITTPYVSRVLGVKGIGISSYAYSIAQYFEIFAALGIALYGNRRIAQVRDDLNKRDRVFWEIISIRFTASFLTIILYIIFVFIFHIHELIFWIYLIDILAVMLDISWFFFGIEEFRITTMQNVAVRIISVILVFLVVHHPDDVWKYAAITCLGNFLGQILLWSIALKKIRFIKPVYRDVKQHIKPVFLLFIPVIAISLYKLMDKIMLGAISGEIEVGYYSSAERIINMPTSVIMALTTVMMPRISNLVEKKDKDSVRRLINHSVDFMSFASVALCFGIMSVIEAFVPLFFGEGYERCVDITMILAPVSIIVSFEQILRTQYLTPNGRDKEYTISTSLGAVVNLIFNSVFIPRFGASGAAAGTLIAEFTVLIYQITICRHELPLSRYFKQYGVFSLFGFIMFLVVRGMDRRIDFGIFSLFVEMGIGALCYMILSLNYMIKKNHVLWLYINSKLIYRRK